MTPTLVSSNSQFLLYFKPFIIRLEQAEEIVSKANSKLVKIEAELKVLAKEAQEIQKEISLSEDSKKLEKLGKRKEAAEQKAEVKYYVKSQ